MRLNIHDSFIKENDGSIIVYIDNGHARVEENGEYDVSVDMDISDFSSLVIGAVSFKSLLRYGAANISDEKYADIVDRIFRMSGKPVCYTSF
jgi:predicted acetyltransferase